MYRIMINEVYKYEFTKFVLITFKWETASYGDDPVF